jgi:demethylmenaquinone methyltransferase/2-methoxy-6-polyprenyl-1,4-benzoquinol methylase
MFGRVARRYDLLNRLISFGRDRHWRREAVRRLSPRPGDRVLDLGSGTGDLALEALRQAPGARLVAADFSPEMVAVGRGRRGGRAVFWVLAEAGDLPFASGAFDGVVSGFLLRNVPDLDRALAEQLRVVRPGGGWAALETAPPGRHLLGWLAEVHLRLMVPLLGRLVAGQAEAYRYLSASTRAHLGAELLARRIEAAGIEQVGFELRAGGAAAIHWGVRRKSEQA